MKLPAMPVRSARDATLNFDKMAVQIPTFVTELPTQPSDGQEVYFLADATKGIIWHLRYRAASTSAFKWEFVGGSPLSSFVAAAEATNETIYVALTTAGPSVTVPVEGEYRIEHGCQAKGGDGASDNGLMSYSVGVAGASDEDAARSCSVNRDSSITVRTKELSTGVALVAKYRKNAGGVEWSFRDRFMTVWPIRVG